MDTHSLPAPAPSATTGGGPSHPHGTRRLPNLVDGHGQAATPAPTTTPSHTLALPSLPLTRTSTAHSASGRSARSVARSVQSARSTRTFTAATARVPTVLLTNTRARTARFSMASHITEAWANASKHSRFVLIVAVLFHLALTALPVSGLAITGRSGYADGCAQLVTLNTAIAMRSFFMALLLPYLFVLQRTSQARGISLSQSPEARIAFEAREVLNWVTAVLFILANFWVFMTPQCPSGSSLVTVTVIWILVTYIVYLTPLIMAVALILCLPCLLVAANHPRLNRVFSSWLHPHMHHGGRTGVGGDGLTAGTLGGNMAPWHGPGPLGSLLGRPRGITSQELEKIERVTFVGVFETDTGEDGAGRSCDQEGEVDHGASMHGQGQRNTEAETLSLRTIAPHAPVPRIVVQPESQSELVPSPPPETAALHPPDSPTLTSSPLPIETPLQLAADDAQCIICFEEYEIGDALHLYKCGHHFHASCSSNWLSLSTLCPLCKQCVVSGHMEDGTGAATGNVSIPLTEVGSSTRPAREGGGGASAA